MIPCRFRESGCGGEAVARYSVPKGCACWPLDTEQDLCLQHASEAEPLGPMRLLAVYDKEAFKLLTRYDG